MEDLTPTGLTTRVGLGKGRGMPSLLLSGPPLLLGSQLEGSMIINRLPDALDLPVGEVPAFGRFCQTLGPVATLLHPPLFRNAEPSAQAGLVSDTNTLAWVEPKVEYSRRGGLLRRRGGGRRRSAWRSSASLALPGTARLEAWSQGGEVPIQRCIDIRERWCLDELCQEELRVGRLGALHRSCRTSLGCCVAKLTRALHRGWMSRRRRVR